MMRPRAHTNATAARFNVRAWEAEYAEATVAAAHKPSQSARDRVILATITLADMRKQLARLEANARAVPS